MGCQKTHNKDRSQQYMRKKFRQNQNTDFVGLNYGSIIRQQGDQKYFNPICLKYLLQQRLHVIGFVSSTRINRQKDCSFLSGRFFLDWLPCLYEIETGD